MRWGEEERKIRGKTDERRKGEGRKERKGEADQLSTIFRGGEEGAGWRRRRRRGGVFSKAVSLALGRSARC